MTNVFRDTSIHDFSLCGKHNVADFYFFFKTSQLNYLSLIHRPSLGSNVAIEVSTLAYRKEGREKERNKERK